MGRSMIRESLVFNGQGDLTEPSPLAMSKRDAMRLLGLIAPVVVALVQLAREILR
jgi:hypothetical protein